MAVETFSLYSDITALPSLRTRLSLVESKFMHSSEASYALGQFLF